MNINELTTEISNSKKYAHVDENVVARIVAEIIPKYPKRKDIIKAVKKELHIIHESFLPEDCHARAETLLDNYDGENIATDQELAMKLMTLHSSTKERIGQVNEIYQYLSNYIKADDKIADIGCGFNPFALPFLIDKPRSYTAYDLSSATVNLLNKYFKQADLTYQALINDIVAKPPSTNFTIALMFKLFPILEHQKKGRAFELLGELNCHRFIISFPLKSASGKEKGMEKFYTTRFETELPTELSILNKTIFDNEMFYILKRHCERSEAIQK